MLRSPFVRNEDTKPKAGSAHTFGMDGIGGLGRLRAWRRRRQLASPGRIGIHSQRQIRALLVEWVERTWRYLSVLVAVATGISALAHYLLPNAVAPYAVGAIGASAVWAIYVLWLDTSGVASLRAGIEGERFTGLTLRPLARRGWRLVHHVMLRFRDVDHVLVGPGGLLAIESKYRARWERVPPQKFAEWASIANKSARDVYHRTGQHHPAAAVVVLWGRHATDVMPVPTELDGVTFCAGADLLTVVHVREASLDATTIDQIFDKLDEYIRTRTVGEERDYGPRPRPIADHVIDLGVGIVAGLVAFVAIASATRLGPTLITWSLASAAAAVVSATVRRWWARPRGQALAIGVFATASLCLAAALAVTVLALVT